MQLNCARFVSFVLYLLLLIIGGSRGHLGHMHPPGCISSNDVALLLTGPHHYWK